MGPISFIIGYIGRTQGGHIYKCITEYTSKFPSESVPVSFRKDSTVISMRVINFLIERFIPSSNRKSMKLKFKCLHEELRRICTENATVSNGPTKDTDSVNTDDKDVSEQDIIAELISQFEGIMEEPTINEFNKIVTSISNRMLFNQTVAVSKNNDGTLEVIMKDMFAEKPNKDYIFAREYLIRVVDVDRLLNKLHDKGIIADIDGDMLTVDDTDFFIDALSYKLMKISERNRENDTGSMSIET
jgi:hypothetical protein